MAFTLVICAMVLDILHGDSRVFMFTVPFVSALILGKQYFDTKTNGNGNNNQN